MVMAGLSGVWYILIIQWAWWLAIPPSQEVWGLSCWPSGQCPAPSVSCPTLPPRPPSSPEIVTKDLEGLMYTYQSCYPQNLRFKNSKLLARVLFKKWDLLSKFFYLLLELQGLLCCQHVRLLVIFLHLIYKATYIIYVFYQQHSMVSYTQ